MSSTDYGSIVKNNSDNESESKKINLYDKNNNEVVGGAGDDDSFDSTGLLKTDGIINNNNNNNNNNNEEDGLETSSFSSSFFVKLIMTPRSVVARSIIASAIILALLCVFGGQQRSSEVVSITSTTTTSSSSSSFLPLRTVSSNHDTTTTMKTTTTTKKKSSNIDIDVLATSICDSDDTNRKVGDWCTIAPCQCESDNCVNYKCEEACKVSTKRIGGELCVADCQCISGHCYSGTCTDVPCTYNSDCTTTQNCKPKNNNGAGNNFVCQKSYCTYDKPSGYTGCYSDCQCQTNNCNLSNGMCELKELGEICYRDEECDRNNCRHRNGDSKEPWICQSEKCTYSKNRNEDCGVDCECISDYCPRGGWGKFCEKRIATINYM